MQYRALGRTGLQVSLAGLCTGGDSRLGQATHMSPVRGAMVNPEQLRELIAEWKRLELIDPSAVPDTDPLGFLVHDGTPSVSAAGYKFVAENEAISSVLIGTGSVAHLE